MLILPIRTECVTRRPPNVNYLLIGANMLVYLLLDEKLAGPTVQAFKQRYLVFQSADPALYQFFTYQFLHADAWHLFGNLIFLWVFGNGVNGKMGGLAYLMFYLSGGVFAAWGHAVIAAGPFRLVGASGSIAAVTTAYLVLFPRARVTVVVWFFFIRFFDLSAMVIIGLKIIVWDNIISPMVGSHGAVAYEAHLAGYLFGFSTVLLMLFFRALPRDQFDILALWKRWNQRREFAAAMSDPAAKARAQFGTAARTPQGDPQAHAEEERLLDEVGTLRARITEALDQGKASEAAEYYQEILVLDPRQCLAERHQLAVARELYGTGRFSQAAAAFERFVESYPRSLELGNVRLLLGIVYARDLMQYEIAEKHLSATMETLRDENRRAQCLEWLENVRAALGRPAPDG